MKCWTIICLLLPCLPAVAGVFTLKGGLSVAHNRFAGKSGQNRGFNAFGFNTHVEYLRENRANRWRLSAASFAFITKVDRMPYSVGPRQGMASGTFRHIGLAPMLKYYGPRFYVGTGPMWSLQSLKIKGGKKKTVATSSSGIVLLAGVQRQSWYGELAHGRQKAQDVFWVDHSDKSKTQTKLRDRVKGGPQGWFVMLTLGKTFF